MIPASIGGVAVGRLQHGTQFLRLRVLDDALPGPLERYGEKLLGALDVLWMPCRDVASERMDCRPADISCSRAVIALRIPITLPVGADHGFSVGDQVALRSAKNELLAVMTIEETYAWDRQETARQVFGTEDVQPPSGGGDVALG